MAASSELAEKVKMVESKVSVEPIYSTITYPTGHFSLSNGCRTSKIEENGGYEDWFVTAVRYKDGPCYMVKVNPGDSRGFRSIVVMIESKATKMNTTLNRPYTLLEKQGLAYVSAIVAHVYEECFKLVAQVEIAGNNAHDFEDAKLGPTFLLGKPSEPTMNHSHLIGRGNPDHVYFPSILPGRKLGGPRPGQMFNMRGDATTPHFGEDVGNMSKGKWLSKIGGEDSEIKRFAKHLETCLHPFITKDSDLEFIFPTLS